MLRQTRRTFVEELDFRTSVGYGEGPGSRERLGLLGGGVSAVVTDIGILEPDPQSCELVLTHTHPGKSVDDARTATGWALRVSDAVRATEAPTEVELAALRSLRYADEEWAGLGGGGA
jgi:glutaconate CoA-transferase subunit B